MGNALKHAVLSLVLAGFALSARAQVNAPPYGPPLTLETAKKMMAAAEAFAKKNNWPVAIVIVDSAAIPVMVHKLDDAQHSAVEIATGKATTAVNVRRPTKVFQDGLAAGGENVRFLKVPGVFPLEGGFPIIVDGKIVGGIGASGVLSSQDSQVSTAGLEALRPPAKP
jgi:glc operon protein GlcG